MSSESKTEREKLARIDTSRYEGHTEGKWILGEYKGRPSISAVEDVETPTWVRSIARGLNPSQTADHALLLDAPLILQAYNEKCEEVERLRQGIRSILSDYDITELIRDVPEDEWNFEQQALIRMKELIL